MSVPSASEIVQSGQAYVVTDSGLCCARCYAGYGLISTLTYRYAPTWGFTARVRWVQTFVCSFCGNEINQPELRLPITSLPRLTRVGENFYDAKSGDLFAGTSILLVEFPPPPVEPEVSP